MNSGKTFENFLKENNFSELNKEMIEATVSDDPDFILRVARRAEKFRMDIEEYIDTDNTAKMLSKCITPERLTELTLRAYNKRQPIAI